MKVRKFIDKNLLYIVLVSLLLTISGLIAKGFGYSEVNNVLLIISSLIAVVPIALSAWSSIKVGVISIELLVTIAVFGAFYLGEYIESAAVTILFIVGEYLEKRTLTKTRESIKKLTDLQPTTAVLVTSENKEVEVDIDDLDAGDKIRIKPGNVIAVDGIVANGTGYVNEAAITGESKSIRKEAGSKVYAGSFLDDGLLTVTATEVGENSTFGKIIELVEEAQEAKSPAEQFIDKFSKYYTPSVLLLAILTFIVTRNLEMAVTLLVLGCPGALVIGAPVANVTAIGNGSLRGVLLKGGDVLNTFSKVDTFVFDKTGTLTKGTTVVTQEIHYTDNPEQVLLYSARIELSSEHPLGKAIVNHAASQSFDFKSLEVSEISTIKGKGMKATINNDTILVGNKKLLNDEGIILSRTQEEDLERVQSSGSSVVLVAVNGEYSLLMGVSDEVREDSIHTLEELHKLGAKELVMLTGDNLVTAESVGKQLGIDTVHAELLPEDKAAAVRAMQASGRSVAFIGDGINDSPSLATADVGVAMGGGTDVAIETGDIVLMNDELGGLAHAYKLSKKTVRNISENIFIAIGMVVFLLTGVFLGFIHMGSGMLFHEASVLAVILNALRLKKVK